MRIPSFRLIYTTLIFVIATLQAQAATLIRDSEIEYALSELARPVLNAAGLSASQIKIILIQDRSMNAFVIDGRSIFIHSGLLLKLESADQLQAVIAHEAAHIANGHLSQRLINMRSSQSAAGVGLLLALATAVAGEPRAAGGIALGSASSAQRQFFAHTRAEEASADNSGIRYMLEAGIDPAAAIEVLDIFAGQELLTSGRQDPYVRSHPLTRDRLRAAQALVSANPGQTGDETNANYWFARAHGKLSAFVRDPGWTLRRTRGQNDTISLMRRAVAQHRIPNPEQAGVTINALVAARPNDPFVHELHGQILLESRQANAAVNAYARAVDLAPRDPLILAGYGRALLAVDSANSNARALEVLERSRSRDSRNGTMLRDLGLAYARANQPGQASLAVAERYALIGRLRDAALHAQRASDQLPRGSAPWQRAQDVLRAAEQINRRQ